jgi:HJR/Mrr/RecB family endonuclease
MEGVAFRYALIFKNLQYFTKNNFLHPPTTKKYLHDLRCNQFNEYGFDKKGYDEHGFDNCEKHKDTNRVVDSYGFFRTGIHYVTQTKFDTKGYDISGNHKDTGHIFDSSGITRGGNKILTMSEITESSICIEYISYLFKIEQEILSLKNYSYIKEFIEKEMLYSDSFDVSITAITRQIINCKNIEKLETLLTKKKISFQSSILPVLEYEYSKNITNKKIERILNAFELPLKTDALGNYTFEHVSKKNWDFDVKQKFVDSFNDVLTYFYELSYILIMSKQPSILLKELDELSTKSKVDEFEKSLFSDEESSINQDILSMNGIEFENFLSKLFEKMGYGVQTTAVTGDQGADLILDKNGEKTIVQAKRWSQKVSNDAVQEAYSAIPHYKAQKGMVVTTNEFQPSAIELAKSTGILLIDIHKLEKLIDEYLY